MSDLKPPITALEFFRGVHLAYPNQNNEGSKPRASSIGNDARQIAYYMAGTPVSDPYTEWDARVDLKYTQEQGRILEDLSANALAAAGLPVYDRQVCIGHPVCAVGSEAAMADVPYTGHPDGAFGSLDDGLVWGWEHKVFNIWPVLMTGKDGLLVQKPEAVEQGILYGHALDWDAVLVQVMAQDASAVRTELRKSKRFAMLKDTEAFHVKGNFYAVDLRPLYVSVLPGLLRRAEWFMEWKENDGDPAHVAWEKEPRMDKFPWSYSEHVSQAISDGQGELVAPATPFAHT